MEIANHTYSFFTKKIKSAFQDNKPITFIEHCLNYAILYSHPFPLIDVSLSSSEDSPIKEMYLEYYNEHINDYIHKKEGYVYIANYPLINKKNIYKVGFTKNIENRTKSLNNASVMGEIIICESFYCKSAFLAESIIHKVLAQYQVDKEFFQIEYVMLKEVIDKVINAINTGLTLNA